MTSLKMYSLLGKRVLVTRDSARTLQPRICAAMHRGRGEILLDFKSVMGIAPSFLDETLHIIEECADETSGSRIRVKMIAPPTELSSKFLAIGRAHGLSVTKAADGSWVISNDGGSPAS